MNIGRNDPCYCGSGKKYKKCCMKKSRVVELGKAKEEEFSKQKHLLVMDIIDFVYKRIDFQEMDSLKAEFRKRITLSQQHPMYVGLFHFWLIFFRRFKNGRRGIEWFAMEGRSGNASEAKLASKWTKLKPALFQVVEPHPKGAMVEDLFTGERVLLIKSESFSTAIPWAGSFALLEEFDVGYMINGVTVYEGPDCLLEVKKKIEQLMEAKQLSYSEVVLDYFPEIFSVLLGRERSETVEGKTGVYTKITYEISDKSKFLHYFFVHENIHIQEWENEDGYADLTGEWYRYEDSEAPGKLYMAKAYGRLEVEGNLFSFSGLENGLRLFHDWLSPVKYILSEVRKEEEPFQNYGKVELNSFIFHVEEGVDQCFGMIAFEQLLIQEPIKMLDHLTVEELIADGRSGDAEWWLKAREYHFWNLIEEGSPTADYNSVRRQLGLSLSPFVTGGEKRKSCIVKVAYPFARPRYLSEQDIPVYRDLGFTP